MVEGQDGVCRVAPHAHGLQRECASMQPLCLDAPSPEARLRVCVHVIESQEELFRVPGGHILHDFSTRKTGKSVRTHTPTLTCTYRHKVAP